VGARRTARVDAIVPFGAFVEIDGAHGLLHRSELNGAEVHVGETVHVEVLAVDRELERFAVRLA
jgi:ribosomal protein S1